MDITATKLSVFFGGVRALDDVCLELKHGARCTLFGPAGGGKTTLLKCLAGLAVPSSGQVEWNARPVRDLSPEQRRRAQADLGMVFQSDALFDSMTVLDNVMLPLRKRRVPEALARERALEALNRVGLSDAAQRIPETLSGGMKKRVGVARAIVAEPQVLLADDPLAGLDPVTAASVAALLCDVSVGKTLMVALPDPLPLFPSSQSFKLVKGRLEGVAYAS